ncbi:hypothetical protein [Bosea sp. Root670]|uniref:hypothetical protein n=1 Tax=Bosea sp. Root670 TaxID=1736583 RepID=UPI0012E3C669|nr:hypothetical protein [Bosea sp. Root670]
MAFHLGMGMSMSVSRPRGETPTIIDPDFPAALPPFWELEDLLATGLDRAAALAVMAARRSGPRLVGAGAAIPEGQSLLLRFGPGDLSH